MGEKYVCNKQYKQLLNFTHSLPTRISLPGRRIILCGDQMKHLFNNKRCYATDRAVLITSPRL